MANLKKIGLTLACFMAGFGFYKVSHGDIISSAAFTIGILGIMMSVFRPKT